MAPPPIENPVWSGWDVLLIAALTRGHDGGIAVGRTARGALALVSAGKPGRRGKEADPVAGFAVSALYRRGRVHGGDR